jgi:hypothetical protein
LLRVFILFATATFAAIWTASIFVDLQHSWWTSDERPGNMREVTIRHGCLFLDSYEGVLAGQRLHMIEWDRPISVTWTPASYPAGERVPLWPLLLVSAAASLFVWKRPAVARIRLRLRQCVGCGYDRAGLATDAKCPECGTGPTT